MSGIIVGRVPFQKGHNTIYYILKDLSDCTFIFIHPIFATRWCKITTQVTQDGQEQKVTQNVQTCVITLYSIL